MSKFLGAAAIFVIGWHLGFTQADREHRNPGYPFWKRPAT
jgi:hypothetical protein